MELTRLLKANQPEIYSGGKFIRPSISFRSSGCSERTNQETKLPGSREDRRKDAIDSPNKALFALVSAVPLARQMLRSLARKASSEARLMEDGGKRVGKRQFSL